MKSMIAAIFALIISSAAFADARVQPNNCHFPGDNANVERVVYANTCEHGIVKLTDTYYTLAKAERLMRRDSLPQPWLPDSQNSAGVTTRTTTGEESGRVCKIIDQKFDQNGPFWSVAETSQWESIITISRTTDAKVFKLNLELRCRNAKVIE